MKRETAELAVLSKLLDDALELAPSARANWIETLPADVDELKPALRRLLLSGAAAETVDVVRIERNVQSAVADAATRGDSPALAPGATVGPYELIRELGRGGMGTVWLARRTEGLLKRVVALKLPHTGLFQAKLVERLARERDILENLAHPHIARLYDAGVTLAGQPYLALEYVEGIPLTTYCDQRRLALRARLDLFVQVLQAIQYAHGNLVVHRDLKPANILVTEAGNAVVLDFGIAKLLTDGAGADSALTQFDGRVLTPDYASPEQISGRPISTASDVYSLGVLLSELLCGARPYYLKRDSRGALEDAIVEAEPRAPSRNATPEAAASRATTPRALARELRGDLDNIVLKALRKDPAGRYATVLQFAQDIERRQRGQAILATPGSVGYRAAKFLRRHKLGAASAAAVVLALMGGAIVALWQARAAQLEAERAEQVKNFALSIIQSADTGNGAGVATTAVELLQRARARVETELANRPAIAAELMAAIGYGLVGQGRPEDGEPLLRKAAEISARENGRDDPRTLEAQIQHGEALIDLGNYDEAIALLTPAIAAARRAHHSVFESDGWRWLSMAQVAQQDYDGAITSARAAIAALGPDPAGDQALLNATLAYLSLANALNSDRRPGVTAAARAGLRYATRLDPALKAPHAAQIRSLLGQGLIRDGQVAAGLRELEQAAGDSRVLLGPEHPQTVQMTYLLGGGLLEAGEVRKAVDTYQASLDAALRHPAALNPLAFASMHLTLASALVAARDIESSLPHYVDAEKFFAEVDGAEAPTALGARSSRAFALARLGRLEEANGVFASIPVESLAGTTKAMYQSRLAVLRTLQGQKEEAVTLARAGVEGLKQLASKTLRAQSLQRLGAALLAAGQPGEAVAPLGQALALYQEAQLSASPDRLETETDLRRAQRAR